jgi:hypothetical protein
MFYLSTHGYQHQQLVWKTLTLGPFQQSFVLDQILGFLDVTFGHAAGWSVINKASKVAVMPRTTNSPARLENFFLLFQYTFQNVNAWLIEFDIPPAVFQWDTTRIKTIKGTNGQSVSTSGQEVNHIDTTSGSIRDSAPLWRDATLSAHPIYHMVDGRPGIRTNGTSVLGSGQTADWLWAGKLIAMVYTKHNSSSTGMLLSRRGLTAGSTTNATGGWMYRHSNTNTDFYSFITMMGIRKKTVAGIANVTLMRISVINGTVMYYLSESVDGKPPTVSTYDTGYTESLPSDASVEFPVGLGGYFGGQDSYTGREFADITLHELLVVEGTEDADNLCAYLRDKWWPLPWLGLY